MTVMLHRFSGTLPAGDTFSFGWHSLTANSVDVSLLNATSWIENLWNGGGPPTGIKTLYAVGVKVTKVRTYQLDAAAPFHAVAVRETDEGGALAGTAVDDSLPQDLSMLVTLRTNDVTRKGRGRFYLPAPTKVSSSATGEITAASQAVILNAGAFAWGVSALSGEHPVVFNKLTGGTILIQRYGVGQTFNIQTRRIDRVNNIVEFDAMP